MLTSYPEVRVEISLRVFIISYSSLEQRDRKLAEWSRARCICWARRPCIGADEV